MNREYRDFDIDALFAALDAERSARGLSWHQVAREISGASGTKVRSIGGATLSGMRGRRALEGDGVLQMLRWLRRTPESFVPGSAAGDGALPLAGPGQVLRFDTRALYAALDTRRVERGLTWKQAAGEIGNCTPSGLTRLSRGGRTAFPLVMRIARWLERPAVSFTRAADW